MKGAFSWSSDKISKFDPSGDFAVILFTKQNISVVVESSSLKPRLSGAADISACIAHLR